MKNFLRIGLFIVLVFTFFSTFQLILAGSGDRIKGYAWSDGVGWVSFNCYNDSSCTTSEYGVNIDVTTGNLEGYAWSDAIGWISFDYCPSAGPTVCTSPTYDKATGRMYGDAMSLTGLIDLDDGWDGIIRLSEFTGTPSYGPEVNVADEIEGYSWGSVVVGWLSYNCTNDSSCLISDYKSEVDDFMLSFTGSDGLSADDEAPYHSNIQLSWQTLGCGDGCSCTPTNGTTAWQNHSPVGTGTPTESTFLVSAIETETNFTLTCTGTGGSVTKDLRIYVKSASPTVILGADDTNIPYDTSINLNWSTTQVDSCIMSGPGNFNPPQSVSIGIGQSAATGNLTALANYYEIECIPSDLEDYPDNFIASITINVEKLIVDFYAEANPLPFNEAFKLIWETEFADACSAHTVSNLTDPPYKPTLPGSGGGLTSTFEGATGNSGQEINLLYFDSDEQPVEGVRYKVQLGCDGNGGQRYDGEIILRVGKNPLFQEN